MTLTSYKGLTWFRYDHYTIIFYKGEVLEVPKKNKLEVFELANNKIYVLNGEILTDDEYEKIKNVMKKQEILNNLGIKNE